MFVTPQKVRQADSMDLFNNLQEFVDNLRKKYGFPTSKGEIISDVCFYFV